MRDTLQRALADGRFGLEKESLRVNKYTLLPSVLDHPFGTDPNISRDFCEAQTEIITPVCENTDALMETLHRLNARVKETLAAQDEVLWNHSNPPAGYDVRRIRIAQYEGLEAEKKEYRKYLREKYGIDKLLLCGIHFNFSFTDEALAAVSEVAGLCPSDRIYMKLAAASMRYAWLITYLTAASPAAVSGGMQAAELFASPRCSRHGYWNTFVPVLDYSGLDAYIDSIRALVDAGRIYSAWELYLPVRLKPPGVNTLDNLRGGISHIELRMLDVNPLAADGICREDVEFLHLLLMMWAVQDAVCLDAGAQRRAVHNMQRAALLDTNRIWIEDPQGIRLPLREAALRFLAQMDRFYETWQDPEILSLIQYQRQKVLNPSMRYAARVLAGERGGQQTATA